MTFAYAASGALKLTNVGDEFVIARPPKATVFEYRPDRLDDLQRRAAGATQARTLCELADALEALTFVRSFCCL